MEQFVIRFQGSTNKHPGIEHISAQTPEDLLAKARKVSEETGLGLTLISWKPFNGNPLQVWNAQREQRTGSGWLKEFFDDAFPGVSFPTS